MRALRFGFRAYGGFASHFPAQADALLHSLDTSYQKLLHGEATLSNSSSSHSLHSAGLGRPPSSGLASSGPTSLPVQSRLKIGSQENINRIAGIPPRKIVTPSYGARPGISNGASPSPNIRSNSAIDLQAVHRAARNIRPVVSSGYGTTLREFESNQRPIYRRISGRNLNLDFCFFPFLFSHVFTEQPLQGRKRPALRIRGRSPRPTTGIPEIVPERQELHSLSVNEITSLLLPSLCLSL